MRDRLCLALLAAALTAFATTCGGGDDDGEAGSPTLSPASGSPLAQGEVRLTYYGHSMFTIETPGGVTILIDPNDGIGYRAPSGGIDLVTVSHEHFDHNKTEMAPDARVLRGLEGDDWVDIDETIGDVRVRTVGTYHDDEEGADRGKNATFVFEIDDLSIVHAGDLGHAGVSFADVPDLGASFRPDVLILPVGGHFTISPQEAEQVIAELRPTITIPMHYRTDFLMDFPDGDELATVDDFTSGKVDVQRPRASSITLEEGDVPPGILVLEPQPE